MSCRIAPLNRSMKKMIVDAFVPIKTKRLHARMKTKINYGIQLHARASVEKYTNVRQDTLSTHQFAGTFNLLYGDFQSKTSFYNLIYRLQMVTNHYITDASWIRRQIYYRRMPSTPIDIQHTHLFKQLRN